MLNGNKSYLISFTALFNKKGYELAIGIDTIFDDARTTQYHLTAPAISTYRTLKMDVMKTATKSPYSASSLFGNRLREAANVTEFEAVEIQTVYANVVSYLSDIQRYFSGENKVDSTRLETAEGKRAAVEAERSGQSEGELYHNVRLDFTVQAENLLEAYRESTETAENIVRAEAEELILSENTKTIQLHSLSDSVNISNIYDTAVQEHTYGDISLIYNMLSLEFAGAENIRPALNISLDMFLDTFDIAPITEVLEQTAADNVATTDIEQFTGTHLTTDIKDAGFILFTSSVRDDELDSAPIEFAVEGSLSKIADIEESASVGRTKDWEYTDIEYFFAASDGRDERVAEIHNAVGSHGLSDMFDGLIEEAAGVSSEYGNELEIVQFLGGQTQDGGEVVIEQMTGAANQLGNELAGPIELVQADHATQQIESAIDGALTAEMIKGMVTESPEVSKMARLMEITYGQRAMDLVYAGMDGIIQDTLSQESTIADSGSITDAIIARMSKALNAGTLEGTRADGMAKGTLEYFGDAVEVKPEYGNVESYGEADNSIRPEYGSIDFTVNAVEAEHEHGMMDNLGEGVLTEPVHGKMDSSAEGESTLTEHGRLDTYIEGVDYKPVHGNAVTFGEGVYHFIEAGERNIGHNGVIHDIGKAIVEANKKLVTVEVPEQSEIISIGKGVLEQPEHGTRDSLVNVELTSIEHGEPTIVPESYFANVTETGIRDICYEGVDQPTETAFRDMELESVDSNPEYADKIDQDIGFEHSTEHADRFGGTYEGMYETPTLAGSEGISNDAVAHETEGGVGNDGTINTIVTSNEWADNHSSGEGVLDNETGLGSADLTLDAIQSTTEGGTGELIHDVVNSNDETANIGDFHMISDNQRLIPADLNGGTVESEVEEDTEADSVLVTRGTDIGEITDSIRKKKVIPTDVVDSVDSQRKKKVNWTVITETFDSTRKKKIIDTRVENGEWSNRIKEVVSVNIEESDHATRPKRVIETAIEKPSEATHKTPPKPKKGRIWLILGKVASWSIWNWKKTR